MEAQRTHVVLRSHDPRVIPTARSIDRQDRLADAAFIDVALRDPGVLIELVRTAGLSRSGDDRRSVNA